MKRISLAGLAMVTVLMILACGGGEGGSGGTSYDDAIEVHKGFANAMEKYIDGIEQAENGSDIADATNAYIDQIEAYVPKMKLLIDKHPELKDRSKLPDELKTLFEKTDGLSKRMIHTFTKTAKFAQDSEVQAAQMRLIKSMTKMK